jgi:tape measure domain-containing protein
MSDDVEFSLGLHGDLGAVARKMAADLKALEHELDRTRTASAKLDSGLLGRAKGSNANDVKALQDHDRAIRNLRRSNLQGAPAMRQMGAVLRGFGAHGSTLRRFTVDAAKTETALRRLYRIKGGGLRGAGAVVGSMASRAWNGGGRAAVGSALWSGVKGAAGMALGGTALAAGGAAAGAGMLGLNMAGTAIEAERVKFALDRITDGNGAKWWATSSDYARKFGLNVNSVADSLMQMKAVGFSDDLAKESYLRFGDMRSQGVSAEGIDRALLGLKQLKAAGIANMEDMNQVTEGLMLSKGLIFEQLGKSKGKTAKEMRDLQGNGKVSSDDMIGAIFKAIAIQTKSPQAGAAGSAATSSTVTGAWDKLKATWSVASADALGGSSLDPLKQSLMSFTSWIEGAGGQKAIGAMGGVMTRLFAAAPGMIEKLIWLLDTGLPEAWSGFTAGLESSGAGAAMDNITSGFRDMAGPDGENAKASLRSFGSDVGALAGSLATLCGWIVKVIGYASQLGDAWSVIKSPILGLTSPGMLANSIGSGLATNGLPSGAGSPGAGPAMFSGTSRQMLMDRMASGGGLSASLDQGIPRVEDATRAAVVSQIPKMAAPVVNQSNSFVIQGADASSPEAIASATSDRSERGLTSLLSQIGYSAG